MKRTLTAFVLGFALLVPNVVWGEGIDHDDLVSRDDLWYEKFSDIPFTGKTSGKQQISIKNGKYHGSHLWYFDNGNLWIKEYYVDGKRHGLYVSRFKNGKVESKGTYKNNSPEGPWVGYYKNGKLKEKGTYKNGNKEGPWVFYKKDGTLRKTPHAKNYDEGTGTYKDDKKISD